MPNVTITLTDTPSGSVQVESDYTPTRGETCSLAQQAALEIINHYRMAYGREVPVCPGCGSANQVWRNQITGALTCHRLSCHTAPTEITSL